MPSQLALQEPEFFKQIFQLGVSEDHDPLTLAQFKNEAKKHLESNDFYGYLAMGTLAQKEGNIEAIHANYQRAIVTSFRATCLHFNALCPMFNTFWTVFSSRRLVMRQAFEFSPMACLYLDQTIHFYGLAGRFHQVGELLKTWDEVSPAKVHKFSKEARNIIAFMDEQHVSDDDLEGLIDIAMSIVRQNKLTVMPEKIEIDLFYGEEPWFHYGIPRHESMAKVVDFNFELVDRSVYECPPQIIKGNFVPSFEAVGDD
jgi:hypothetical protein